MDLKDRRQHATILVVDDEDCLRSMVEAVLEQEGFNVLSAPTGEDALLVAHGHEGCIDLLLTDLCMPGISGAVLGIKFSKDYPYAKIIYMTATASEELAGKLDGETVLFKPFHIAQLLAAIKGALVDVA